MTKKQSGAPKAAPASTQLAVRLPEQSATLRKTLTPDLPKGALPGSVGDLARDRLNASPEGKVAITLTTAAGERSELRVDSFPWCAVCQDYVTEVQEWREARRWRPGEPAPARERSFRVRCHGKWDVIVVPTSETGGLKIGGVAFEAEARERKQLGP